MGTGAAGLVVAVEVLRPNPAFHSPPASRAMVPGVADALGQLVVIVRVFLAVEDASWGADISYKYAKNIIRNAVNCDMAEAAQLLARFCNA
eukprot:m51a1_g12780 hypothetical protein (91) ;mRNA; r:2788-3175